jgi:hypothetical protein
MVQKTYFIINLLHDHVGSTDMKEVNQTDVSMVQNIFKTIFLHYQAAATDMK